MRRCRWHSPAAGGRADPRVRWRLIDERFRTPRARSTHFADRRAALRAHTRVGLARRAGAGRAPWWPTTCRVQTCAARQRRRRATCLAERRSICWRWANGDTRCSQAVRTSAMSARLGSSDVLAFAANASTRRSTERASRSSASVRFISASTAVGSDGLITAGVCPSARRHFRSDSGRFTRRFPSKEAHLQVYST